MKNLNYLRKKLPLTVELRSDHVLIIDQTKLPGKLKFLKLKKYPDAISAIKEMQVRGAQAIGAVGAGGIFLAGYSYKKNNASDFYKYLQKIAKEIIKARPTAVNLAWGVKTILADLEITSVLKMKAEIKHRYKNILEQEVGHNLKIGEYGNTLIKSGMTILTHCNAGSLSAIWFGTATAPIFQALMKGKNIKVRLDETRPWLQGSRLTAWEMERTGIDYTINIDSAVGYLMSHGLVDMVIVGADHIASNGDTANKIGTYPLALMAHEWKIPFYVAAVSATIDFSIKTGALIKIEERSGDEILRDIRYKYQPVSPQGAKSFNPIFDITPHKLITGIITEYGISKSDALNLIKGRV
ncbi:S-methyl-5-thioribose-1-phosphate isomerase [Candidatus Falkowbacteria bacterium CG_4_10_14_0_8_um_filter_41_36]|uniref:S-methyl-5-thioribose-1-phosphate isomerase n=2 Tax=Candidatus Falkowiibacteriota TaxID=1752728 RepID=A0A2G9ZM68_9BACT|nr:MAG: S-methyl-5-thioribose-1-phosphate isomerase [Candidatus Falkowbacteria bacterium CG23_combo_of_CG06-09_8_20_14_all_41_10]PIZ11491.1 MAG: S-methyl-5-thioribose-1-phosphate isomerase [Candidatus Falkowbacteria bacterium CG_4_10_14_0_8_um_filter_41_36]